MGSVQTSALYL